MRTSPRASTRRRQPPFSDNNAESSRRPLVNLTGQESRRQLQILASFGIETQSEAAGRAGVQRLQRPPIETELDMIRDRMLADEDPNYEPAVTPGTSSSAIRVSSSSCSTAVKEKRVRKPNQFRKPPENEEDRELALLVNIADKTKCETHTIVFEQTSYKAALSERAAIESEGSCMLSSNQLDPQLSIFTEVTGGVKKGRLVSFGRGYSPPKKRTSQIDIEQDPKFIELKEELNHQKTLLEEQDKKIEEQQRKMEELYRNQAHSNEMIAKILSQMTPTQREAMATDFRPGDFAPW